MKNPDITFNVRATKNTASTDMIQKNEYGVLQFDKDGYPIMMLKPQALAFEGLCIVEASRTEYFGGIDSKSYRSDVIANPTWMQLWFICASQAEKTRDFYHTNIVAAHVIRTEKSIDSQVIKIIEFELAHMDYLYVKHLFNIEHNPKAFN